MKILPSNGENIKHLLWKWSETNDVAIDALKSELQILINLGSHLNVVNLLGACTKQITKGRLNTFSRHAPICIDICFKWTYHWDQFIKKYKNFLNNNFSNSIDVHEVTGEEFNGVK